MNKDDVYQMTMQLRCGIGANKPEVKLSGEVECDEVDITAGHKGQPEVMKKTGALVVTALKGFGVVVRSKRNRRYLG